MPRSRSLAAQSPRSRIPRRSRRGLGAAWQGGGDLVDPVGRPPGARRAARPAPSSHRRPGAHRSPAGRVASSIARAVGASTVCGFFCQAAPAKRLATRSQRFVHEGVDIGCGIAAEIEVIGMLLTCRAPAPACRRQDCACVSAAQTLQSVPSRGERSARPARAAASARPMATNSACHRASDPKSRAIASASAPVGSPRRLRPALRIGCAAAWSWSRSAPRASGVQAKPGTLAGSRRRGRRIAFSRRTARRSCSRNGWRSGGRRALLGGAA